MGWGFLLLVHLRFAVDLPLMQRYHLSLSLSVYGALDVELLEHSCSPTTSFSCRPSLAVASRKHPSPTPTFVKSTSSPSAKTSLPSFPNPSLPPSTVPTTSRKQSSFYSSVAWRRTSRTGLTSEEISISSWLVTQVRLRVRC